MSPGSYEHMHAVRIMRGNVTAGRTDHRSTVRARVLGVPLHGGAPAGLNSTQQKRKDKRGSVRAILLLNKSFRGGNGRHVGTLDTHSTPT
jgi:hypothetical protein